ncbi:metal ABC transporter solute-binding protein, Zn/Mn family [Dactylosporangium salmoneum]|uniref:Zinc ABC transporter substrate-binding protein n=1 Tax=Dactylosporangium salmoneum TaxID=53361 RepID=A0ABP5UBC8_9ACTN
MTWWSAGALSLAMFLTACGSSSSQQPAAAPASPAGGATVSVVASTNVYGDIVKQIAGDRASITSIISNPDADPHSYEANTRTQLELSKAKVVIENGGGYDDFVDTMLKSAGGTPKVLNVVDISGKKAADGEELNEHVWYDFATVEKLADQLAAVLGEADPAGAATFTANAATFKQKVQQLQAREAAIKAAHTGAGVAITEPVPLYMLQACGLVNKTPAEFSEAIEEGTDVPANVLQKTLDLFAHKDVALLAYNEQTAGPETEKVLNAAKAANVAVVPVTETLPDGKDYLSWMGGNLTAIETALR